MKGVGTRGVPTPFILVNSPGLGELDEQHPISAVTSCTVAPPGGAIPLMGSLARPIGLR